MTPTIPVPQLVTSEPVLGPRQSQLVWAMSVRLANGSTLSQHDFDAFAFLAGLLGLVPDEVTK